MKKILLAIAAGMIFTAEVNAQQSPNLANAATLSPTTEKAIQAGGEDVSLFTGVPRIGVPLYSYSNPGNSLSLHVSLDYYAGGIGVDEAPTFAGLGWYLNAGGIITRIVRGQADEGDEYLPNGFLYTDTIANDWRAKGAKYYNDTLDAEQDIFQYNFNGRSGTFYIGKNGQVAQVPLTKLKIIPQYAPSYLSAIRIIAEDGVTYVFDKTEQTDYYYGSINDHPLLLEGSPSSWALTKIISPFKTDTIQLSYVTKSITRPFEYPEIVYRRNSDGVRTKKLTDVQGHTQSATNKISSIVFPDKTSVSFYYDTVSYYGNDQALLMIKIGDTVFRKGYLMEYEKKDSNNQASRLLLKSVVPFSPTRKGRGYTFGYSLPGFKPLPSGLNPIGNKMDYWGYYNGAANDSTSIPDIDGYNWQADRTPNINYAVAATLKTLYLPSGGTVTYDYELNDHAAFTKDPHTIYFNPVLSSFSNESFSQVYHTLHEIVFTLDSSLSRDGTPPITGTGKVTLNIKNTAGTVTYATYSLSLYDLFYKGIQVWDFNVPDGTYKLEQSAATGTTITGSFMVKLAWENKVPDALHTAVASGGLRVKRITRRAGPADPAASVEEYKYVNADGTSSGFMGDIPKYTYPYRETVNYGGVTTTNYTVYSSDPLFNNIAGVAGYSRVEVIKGTSTHHSGKTVYEFTSPADVNAQYVTATFPYAPVNMREWALGLPKKISVYDSAGNLVKKTTNTYTLDTSVSFTNKNFRSLKLGNSYTYINGNPANDLTPRTFTFLGIEYYPHTGRIYLSATTDTLYQSDGSKNASYTNYTYDTNYNVIKTVTSYDKTRGLQLEKRIYYPYNYTVGDGVGLLRDSGIISPVIATEAWITGDATPRIVSGTITSYHQVSGGYVLPSVIYALQSNKPVPQSTIGTFSASVLNRNTTWFKAITNLTGYDSKGNLLQVQDAASGASQSTIMDYGQRYVTAQVSNAVQADIACTSFEADGTGNWTIAGAQRDTTSSVTGKRSYNLGNGNITKSGLTSSVSYYISVWAKSGATVKVNGTTLATSLASQNGWNLYATTVTGITTATISGTGLVDELRLHPKDANMITYTYQPMAGVTSTADASNTILYNEYDGLNRLKLVRDKDRNILKRYDYSDSEIVFNTSPQWVFSRTSCAGSDGAADSVFRDTNLYSATYDTEKRVRYQDFCACQVPSGSHPEYKYVSGHCEAALKCVTSSSYVKIVNPDNTFYFTWKCTWHYKWSDGSVSVNYIDYHDESCPIGCMPIVEIE